MCESNVNNCHNLISFYEEYLAKYTKESNVSNTNQIKASLNYIEYLCQNSEIDPSDEQFKKLNQKCKQAIETGCKHLFSNLLDLAIYIKDKSSKKETLDKSSDSSDKENVNSRQDIDNEENSLISLMNKREEELFGKGANSDAKTTNNEAGKQMVFTSAKSKRTTKLELVSKETRSGIEDSKMSKGSESFMDDILDEDLSKKEDSPQKDITSTHLPDSDESELKNLTEDEYRKLQNIKKLDSFCLELNEKIKDIENKELACEDLSDERSNFVYLASLKRKFVQAYNKLAWYCKKYPHLVQNEHKIVKGRAFRFSKKCKFNDNDEINNYISECLQKNRQFPDFWEVLDWVKAANIQHNLNLDDNNMFKIAQVSLGRIGKILKSRRKADDYQIQKNRIESHKLNSVETDPAESDHDLQTTLEKNKEIFEQNIEKLFESYVEKEKVETDKNEPNEEMEEGEESENDEARSEEEIDEINDETILSLPGEDHQESVPASSQSFFSDSEEQVYGTPPETVPDVGQKRMSEESPNNPIKRIKLEDNSNTNGANLDKSENNLPKIVECSSATDDIEECIVLD